MVIDSAAKSANFQICSPSANDLRSPKKRVMNDTRMRGTRVPATACSTATRNPTKCRKSFHSPATRSMP